MPALRVPQFMAFVDEHEALAVADCVRSNWITEGPRCAQFVEKIKKLANVEYGVLAPNGTLALYLALKACGIEPGDEVLVPDLTFIATATAVTMAGASPVFVDVNHYGQMSLDAAEAARSPKTTAFLPVHLYGAASNECPRRGPLGMVCIEDACQGLGVQIDGEACGSLGNASAFSFFADKTITTGEGGFVGTNDEAVYDRLRYLRNQGRIDRGSFIHPQIGQNFRMTDIQASIGLVQLEKMPEIIERKRAIHARYVERLSGVVRILEPSPGSTHIPFRTVAFFHNEARLAEVYLREHGVESRSAFYPLHRQPCFSHLANDPRHTDGLFTQANAFWDQALCLPVWPGMTAEQVEIVCDVVTSFVEERVTP